MMAVVPIYKADVADRPVAPGYQSTSGASIDAFGGGAAKGLADAGRQLEHTAEGAYKSAMKRQIEDNERDAKDRVNKYDTELELIGFGDGTDQNQGYYASRGQNAIDGHKSAVERAKTARSKILEGASPRVAELAGDVMNARDRSESKVRDRFLMTERERANDATAEARKATVASRAASLYNDPVELASAISVAASEDASVAERKGFSPEIAAFETEKSRTVVIQGAIKAALAADDINTAQKIFDTHADKMNGLVRADVAKALRNEGIDKISQSLADKAMSMFPNDREAGMKWLRDNAEGKSEAAAVADLRSRYGDRAAVESDARARAADLHRITTQAREDLNWQHTVQERERTERLRGARKEAEDLIESGKPYSAIPAEVRAELDGAKVASLQKRAAQLATGEPLVTDWGKNNEYTAMTADQLRNVDVGNARTELADAEFTQVKNLVLAANQGKIDPQSPDNPMRIFGSRADELGLVGNDKKDDRGRLQSMFLQEVGRAEEANGNKHLSSKEVREILNTVTDPVAMNSWKEKIGLSGPKPLFKVKVPEEDRKKIIEYYAQTGKPKPTELDIVNAYLVKKNK